MILQLLKNHKRHNATTKTCFCYVRQSLTYINKGIQ